MPGITPYIAFKGNCREAIEFYKSALGAELVFMQTVGESPMSNMGPAGNIMHATLKLGDTHLMMCDDPTPGPPAESGSISLAIGLNDAALAHKYFSSLADGGAVIMPLEKTYWAEAFGILTDKYGVKWMVNCEAAK